MGVKLGIVSDTHGGFACWEELRRGMFSSLDAIVHAGDIFYHGTRNPLPSGYDTLKLAMALNELPFPLHVAQGNCDSEVDQMVLNHPIHSPFLLQEIEELKILVKHWHREGESSLLELAERLGAEVIITGHSHIPRLEEKKGKLILNPGSPALPKDGSGTAAMAEISGREFRVEIREGRSGKVFAGMSLNWRPK